MFFSSFPRQLLLETYLHNRALLKPRSLRASSVLSFSRCVFHYPCSFILTVLPHNQCPLNLVIYLSGQNILRWFIVHTAQGCELDESMEQRTSYTQFLQNLGRTKNINLSVFVDQFTFDFYTILVKLFFYIFLVAFRAPTINWLVVNY